MESESLPLRGTAPAYERPGPADATLPEERFEPVVDDAGLERVERRLVKHLSGAGLLILHDLAVPATATTIDHLCVGSNAVTVIDVERAPGDGRADLVDRVLRETEILAAVLHEAGVRTEQIGGAICRSTRAPSLRASSAGPIVIGDPRAVARLAKRRRSERPIDVQLALAVVRDRLGHEGQRSHRCTRPDGF